MALVVEANTVRSRPTPPRRPGRCSHDPVRDRRGGPFPCLGMSSIGPIATLLALGAGLPTPPLPSPRRTTKSGLQTRPTDGPANLGIG